jgi:hypothetical protein
MHTFKRFWDTMECSEKLRDQGGYGDMDRYWDITEVVRDINGNN